MNLEELALGNSPNDGQGDELRGGGGKINRNFQKVKKWSNNRQFQKYVNITDWSVNVYTQLADFLNTTNHYSPGDVYDGNSINVPAGQFVINPQDIVEFYCYKPLAGGNVQDQTYTANFQVLVFGFRKGEGVYGINGPSDPELQAVQTDFFLKSKYNQNVDQDSIDIDLGEIGITTIEDYVVANGAYNLQSNISYVFVCTRSGVPFRYWYRGPQGINVGGSGNYAPVEEDFISLTEVEPAPVDLTDYVTQEQFLNSAFAYHQNREFEYYIDIDLTAETEDFIIIREEENDTYYFAVKQSFPRNFDNASIKPEKGSGERIDLTVVDDVVDGYNLYDIGPVSPNYFDNGELQGLFVWLAAGGGEGTVQSWNNIEPDEDGNIAATAENLPAGSSDLENSDGANQDEINEDLDLSITQINEELPNKENKSKIETVIDTGGNYPDLDSNRDIYIFDHSDVQAVLSGIVAPTYNKRIQIRVVNSESVRIISENASVTPTDQILMPSDSFPYGKGSVIELQYSFTYNRWVFISSKGSGYEPELVGNDSTIVEVDQLGGLYRGTARDLFNTNAVKTTLYTSDATLNTDYPDAIKGEFVFCPQTLQVSQKLENGSIGKWNKGFVDKYDSGILACTLVSGVTTGSITARILGDNLIVRGSFTVDAGVDDTNAIKVFDFPTEVASVVANRYVVVSKEATSNEVYVASWAQASNAVYVNVTAGESYNCYFQTPLKDVL